MVIFNCMAWNNYCILKNKVINSIRNAHTKYQSNLFTRDKDPITKLLENTLRAFTNTNMVFQHLMMNNDDRNTVTSSKEKPTF